MAIAIRVAAPADIALLGDVERSAGRSFLALPDLAWISSDQVSPPDDLARLAAAGTVWVGEETEVVGFLSAEQVGDSLHVLEVAVAQPHQQRGVGRRLMAAAEAHARATGLAALTLTTFTDVAWNAPFYARLGYVRIAEEALGEHLATILAEERARGLPRRCAMRLAL